MEVKFNNVNFYYDKKTKVKSLDTINLKIKANTVVGITGKSGSGKTTLVELLTGLIVPTSGKITIDDIVVNKKSLFDKLALKNKVGYVPKTLEDQFFNKTVNEELSYPFKFLNREVSEEELINALKSVNLDESYLVKNPLKLSNGEKRKLAIASVIILNPDLIILDEPAICLDGKSVKQLERLIKNLKSNLGKTVIVISRDVEFLHKVSDQVVVMNEGKILISGEKYEVFKSIDLLKKYEIPIPETIEFSHLVLDKKNIRIGYRDEVNDLLKDIYRYVK